MLQTVFFSSYKNKIGIVFLIYENKIYLFCRVSTHFMSSTIIQSNLLEEVSILSFQLQAFLEERMTF